MSNSDIRLAGAVGILAGSHALKALAAPDSEVSPA
jgi:hypothetical protein